MGRLYLQEQNANKDADMSGKLVIIWIVIKEIKVAFYITRLNIIVAYLHTSVRN